MTDEQLGGLMGNNQTTDETQLKEVRILMLQVVPLFHGIDLCLLMCLGLWRETPAAHLKYVVRKHESNFIWANGSCTLLHVCWQRKLMSSSRQNMLPLYEETAILRNKNMKKEGEKQEVISDYKPCFSPIHS